MPPPRSNVGQVRRPRQLDGLRLHRPQPLARPPASSPEPGCGQAAQVDERVARPGDPLVELDDRLASASGRRAPHLARAPRPGRRRVCRSSTPDRVPDAELLEQPAAAGLAAQVGQPRVGAVHRDAEAQRDVALERRSCCRGSGGSGPGWGSARGSGAAAGDARAACAQRPGDASPTDTSVSRARAWLRDDPGQQRRGSTPRSTPRPASTSRRPSAAAAAAAAAAGTAHRSSIAWVTVPLRRGGALEADRRHHDDRLVVEVAPHRVPHVRHRLLQPSNAA